MSSRLHIARIFLPISLLAAAACSRDQAGASANAQASASAAPSASAPVAQAPTGPFVRCLDLKKTPRLRLRPSADRKSLYYLALDDPKDAIAAVDEDVAHYSMVTLDVATKTEKKIADDVSLDAQVTNDGLVVYGRRDKSSSYGRHIYSRDPAKDSPVRLTAEGKPASSFYVDPASAKVVYEQGGDAYEVPASGGEPKKLIKAWYVVGGTEEGTLVGDAVNEYSLLPFNAQPPRKVALPSLHRLVALSHGLAITTILREKAFHLVPLTPIEKGNKKPTPRAAADADAGADAGAASDVLFAGMEHDNITLLPTGNVVYANVKMNEERAIFEVGPTEQKKLLSVKGIDLSGYAPLDADTIAVLACQDTYENDSCSGYDETDVCFIERAQAEGRVEIPIRKIPGAMEGVVAKLAPLLEEPDLKGSRMRFHRVEGEHYRVVMDSPADGPTTLDALRERVRAIQKRVTDLSGMPALDVSVEYANGYHAESHFEPKQKQYVTYCGIGGALVHDTKDYAIELDPKVIVGSASTCTGTLKNLGDAPLENLEVVCSVGSRHEKDSPIGRSKTKPAVIPPGKEAKYATPSFAYNEYGDEKVRLTVLRGEEELLFANRYSRGKTMAVFEAAEKVLPTTGLVYWYPSADEGDYTVHAIVTETFTNQSADKQLEACTSVAKAFAPVAFYSKVLPKDVSVRIYDRAAKKLQWTFTKGKLEPAPKKGT